MNEKFPRQAPPSRVPARSMPAMLGNGPLALVRGLVEGIRRGVNQVRYHGNARYCPVCGGHAARFQPAGAVPRAEAKCPYCGALERHRLLWLFFVRQTDLFDAPRKRMLHVAPERAFASKLVRHPNLDYLSADFSNERAMEKMDITDIGHPDDSFDVIYCSHVLEHVLDDRRAMRELHRVLKPSGWAVLQVPMGSAPTYEDASITEPAARERAFGQWDHVRVYGPDYQDRLEEAGFRVKRHAAADIASDAELDLMRIRGEPDVYYCTK